MAVAAEMKTSESLNYMKRITVIGKAVGLVVCLAVSSAQAGGVGCVVDQVLESSKATTITMHEQSFTIEPVKAGDKQKVAYTLAGMIRVEGKSSAAASHEIAYRITKEKGAVKKIELQTDGGAWQSISQEMMRALGDYTKSGPITEEKQQQAHNEMYRVAKDGSWQKSAELIVAFVAVRYC